VSRLVPLVPPVPSVTLPTLEPIDLLRIGFPFAGAAVKFRSVSVGPSRSEAFKSPPPSRPLAPARRRALRRPAPPMPAGHALDLEAPRA
jgi:hypothetical protein